MAECNITICVDKEIIDKINGLAKMMDRSRNRLVEDALALYIETNEHQVQGILKAMESAKAGNLIAFEEFFAKLDKQIENKISEINKDKN